MTLREFLTKHLPADWTKKACAAGKKFAETSSERDVGELLLWAQEDPEGRRYLRWVAIQIFGDRAWAAMEAVKREALSHPRTWETAHIWDKTYLDGLTACCVGLLRPLVP